MALLNDQEKKSVSEAIARAEATTAGELVVVTAGRADAYVAVRALWALPLTVLIATELFVRFHDLSPWIVFVSQIPIGLGLYWILGWAPLLRLLVPRRIVDEAVDACAKRAFIDLGVTETRDRSGVLLLLCEAEHRVLLLADRGINERVAEGEWQRDVDDLTQALKAGRAEEGVLKTIDAVGALLAANFAPKPGDTNELGNEVREI